MSIPDNYTPLRELGNGVTTEFSDTWSILSADYIEVYLEDVTTGVQTLVNQGGAADEYTVTFNSSGFVVTFNTAPTSSNYVVVGRNVTLDQTTPYKTSKGFQGEATEGSFDKLTAIVQDQQDEVNRSLKFQLGSTSVGSLPVPADDTPIGWDGTTGAIKNGGSTFTDIDGAITAVAALAAQSGVKVSANDATVGFLNGKLIAGTNVTFTENNDGGSETLDIDVVVPDATTTTKGIVEAAETAEMTAGTADKFPDCAKVKAYVDSKFILGSAYTSSTTVDSTTNAVPADSTIPQVSEMDLALSQAYTPVSATSTIVVEYGIKMGSNTTDTILLACLFVDAATDAVDVTPANLRDSLDLLTIVGRYEVTSGSTTERTYKAYYGGVVGTKYLNQTSGGITFGGLRSWLKVTEYA